jgi:EAL domain-containing protein (putative c-di-GMP-specific phosphodiesterase class I)
MGPIGNILLVDDDVSVLNAYGRILSLDGHDVQTASSGPEAINWLKKRNFDVVLTDFSMPGMNGLELLVNVRKYDLDVPVVLVTGNPSLETVMTALEFGALRYLTKPVDAVQLRAVTQEAVRLHRLALLKRQALGLLGMEDRQVGDLAGLEARFNSALDGIWMAYQPIVSLSQRRVIAYEALLRSEEKALPQPEALLAAAESLGRRQELSRAIRNSILASMDNLPEGLSLFINLHPFDLQDGEFLEHHEFCRWADRIVLEITEDIPLHKSSNIRQRVKALKELGFRVALDDMGSGYAGLSSFAQLSPDVVKIDRTIITNIELEETRQHIVRSMLDLCKDLGIMVIVEGVETAAQRTVLADLGAENLQGYFFCRPAPPFPEVLW